jgi:hypothetical protein
LEKMTVDMLENLRQLRVNSWESTVESLSVPE